MEIEILEQSKNRIKFKLKGENHTFCNILRRELWNDKATKVAGYKIEHALEREPVFLLETDGKDPKKVLEGASERLRKEFKELETRIRKIWNFIWYDDSPLSWIINIILALILVKFLIYPGLGLVLGTTHPLVAVVSGSMEHDGMGFDDWWESNGRWYEENNIKKEEFEKFPFKHGFNKGDIMVLINSRKINVGDVIVYNGNSEHPIIH